VQVKPLGVTVNILGTAWFNTNFGLCIDIKS